MSASERKIAELEEQVANLKHLLSAQMRTGEELSFEAIVNQDGVALVNLRWDLIAAQVSVDEAREMALDLFRVCEWAEVDAKVFRWAKRELDERAAGVLMAILREGRGSSRTASAAGVDNV